MFKTMVRALLCALAIGGSSLANAAQPIVIKFSHVVAENTPKGQARCCSRNSSNSAWAAGSR